MAEHKISLSWKKGDAPFTYEAYSRNHRISFKNGAPIIFSAAPAYKGDAGFGDPEDMLVAALSSCHMLSFLYVAASRKHTVLSYEDEAVGYLEKEGGKLWIARTVLRPKIAFETAPSAAELAEMHHLAHAQCFIANSVKTNVTVEPR